jgi:hypothetical protein
LINNSRRDAFLAKFPDASIDLPEDTLASRCKFNFSYFEVQEAGQSFENWDHDRLCKFLEKLKHYGQNSLQYWRTQAVAGGRTILEIYGDFPHGKSDFMMPKHIPRQALWGRFRLESTVRVVGFVLPPERDGEIHEKCKARFDCNTFYVVFFDAEHRFYKTEKK